MLSLNGVANGDLPITAITGFGFHLQKSRPVAKKEVVEKLGLRENPSSVCCFALSLYIQSHLSPSSFVSSRLVSLYIPMKKIS
jgi:hypothetical protein